MTTGYEVADFSVLHSNENPEIVGWYASWPKSLNRNYVVWYLLNPKAISTTNLYYWDGKEWLHGPQIDACVYQERYWFGLRLRREV